MKLLLAVLGICVTSCALTSHLTKEEIHSVRDLARKKVLASGVLKEAQEIELIRNVEPKLSYYFLARPHADYSIEWVTVKSERIVVHGRGDILKLEGANVQRFSKSGT